MSGPETKAQQVERSLSKTYRKSIWVPFIQALKTYELLSPGDCVGVCVSGGKDSMLLAVLLQMLQKYSDFPFSLRFLAMDPGYTEENRRQLEENCALLHIPVTVFSAPIFRYVDKNEKSPCYLCARMRRGYLYAKAKELGCNKIALGHHANDAIETTLLGMLYAGKIEGMRPKLKSKNFPGMELIRPLYCVEERAICNWQQYNDLHFLRCACTVTAKQAQGESDSKRAEVKALIANMKKTNPDVEKSLFQSLHHVNADTMVGYKVLGKERLFTADYREPETDEDETES